MSKKILIIEDNNDIRESVIEILELSGYTAFGADQGKTGVALALKHLPDVILCDIAMPEIDGYGVLYLLKKNPATVGITFIFLTAKAERLELRKGMEMGADDYLTKPFSDIDLLKAIEGRLNKKELVRNSEQLSNLLTKHNGLLELEKITQACKARRLKKSHILYFEGDSASGIYLVISGRVKTIKLAKDGREFMTGIYSAGQYLAINVILSNEPYTDTATAMEDCVVCVIPKIQLDGLLLLHPDVSGEFIKLLSNDIREKEEQLMQLAYFSVRKKMAEAILRVNKHKPAEHDYFKISREDLAAMACMATETVSRTLSDFKTEGLIERNGSTITILNLAGLTKMKN
ncbi:response regulator [Pedobacter sp. L105]|uniref:response regulator n=1 Tax=Pedobacter sp. L105 TaxID=1641871 RepID=UPI00131C3947|nr:response regulator [Pedobacter sp. L105]